MTRCDGELRFDRLNDGTLRLIRADPRITLASDMVDALRSGRFRDRSITVHGDLFRIEALDRTVFYRIGELAPGGFAYYAEWPD